MAATLRSKIEQVAHLTRSLGGSLGAIHETDKAAETRPVDSPVPEAVSDLWRQLSGIHETSQDGGPQVLQQSHGVPVVECQKSVFGREDPVGDYEMPVRVELQVRREAMLRHQNTGFGRLE